MSNIIFNTYSPPPEPKGNLAISLGVFFDGTLNNKTNTEERRNNTQAYKDHGEDPDDNNSYNNDYSNVARLWDCYDKEFGIYVEGIGTIDKKGDVTDGYAFGAKETGIKAKVKIGCEKIAKKVKAIKDKNKDKDKVFLTLDAFGFSRGAAAARHFVYETSRKKDEARGILKYGVLGDELKKAGVEIESLSVRFLGIYDTVSSFSEDVWTSDPNFNNDIEELHLDEIASAKKIVHFVAENEHRINFDLTDVAKEEIVKGKRVLTYYGIQKKFPGVHCDIGGAYETGTENKDEIINGGEEVLIKRKNELIAQGWFKENQLIVHDWKRKLSGSRFLKKTYSYIPLHFMADYGINSDLPFAKAKMENDKFSITDDALLLRVKSKLKPYVLEDGKSYDFKTFNELHTKYKGAKIPEQKYLDYQRELKEQNDLRKLRNEYLHWSADYDWVGMDPREDGVRVVH